jgi:hypothetical protein
MCAVGRESHDDETLSPQSADAPASEVLSDNDVSNSSEIVENFEQEEEEEGYHYIEHASALHSDDADDGSMMPSNSTFGRVKKNLRIVTIMGRKKQLLKESSQILSVVPNVGDGEKPSQSSALYVQTSCTSMVQSTISSTYNEAIRDWQRECRHREKQEFFEMLQQYKNSEKFCNSFNVNEEADRDDASFNKIAWWQKNGQLAVFDAPKVHAGRYPEEDSDIDYSSEKQSSNYGDAVLGTLAPGTVVWGMEFIHVLSQQQNKKETLDYVFLKIESPIEGYVLYSHLSYAYLAPGYPMDYIDPSRWIWRISCLDGAFVREGLELSSKHITTLDFGKFVRVSQKIVNSMGLSRLCIEQHDECWTNDDGTKETPKSAIRRRRTPNPESAYSFHTPETSPSARSNPSCYLTPRCLPSPNMAKDRLTTELLQRSFSNSMCLSPICAHGYAESIKGGWISEALNPLSGQRGAVAQPLPFPVPALYRVTYPEGAIIRSDIELSSTQIGFSPYGSILKVVGRTFSEHPMDRCIDRLKLAGGAGWVSVRLNKPPPYDILIVELVGIDEDFDVLNPGVYHLKALESTLSNNNNLHINDDASRLSGQENIQPLHHKGNSTTSSFTEGSSALVTERNIGSNQIEQQKLPASVVSVQRKSGKSRRRHYSANEVNEDKCLICLIEERSATIVHAGTGHIACCLACARILKARGDKCPVCRLPIDSVIQQFWA